MSRNIPPLNEFVSNLPHCYIGNRYLHNIILSNNIILFIFTYVSRKEVIVLTININQKLDITYSLNKYILLGILTSLEFSSFKIINSIHTKNRMNKRNIFNWGFFFTLYWPIDQNIITHNILCIMYDYFYFYLERKTQCNNALHVCHL